MIDATAPTPNPPSMTGGQAGAFLRRAAASVPSGMAIVEVGTWFGAGTRELAIGAMSQGVPPDIHSYDIFVAKSRELKRLAASGLSFEPGQDTRPVVEQLLAPTKAPITLHKGDIMDARWPGGPIGLYVDDAAKTPSFFFSVLDTFMPHWVPGETVVALMDFSYWEKLPPGRGRRRHRVQHEFIARHSSNFERVEVPEFKGQPCAAFRYVAPVPGLAIKAKATVARLIRRRRRE